MISSFTRLELSPSDAKAMTDVRQWMSGRSTFVSFAEVHDDGSRQFPALATEKATEAANVRDRFAEFAALSYAMALRRDATYAAATRGELNALAAKTKMITAYDVLNIVTQAGL